MNLGGRYLITYTQLAQLSVTTAILEHKCQDVRATRKKLLDKIIAEQFLFDSDHALPNDLKFIRRECKYLNKQP